MKSLITAFVLVPCLLLAQSGRQPDGAALKLKLRKLNFLGSVLYVAAHPDDENTRIITAMANDRLAATAYLSMTRGDGGQNLIGPEIRDLLGLIRTQELLAARRLDGGQQFFTRANDFGFSKSATETFNIWGHDDILRDVVWTYRKFQPDVIITRFPPDERAGHGHHTASAILAQEAFDEAAQPTRFPHPDYTPWQPKRLYTNTGRWWNNTINESTPGVLTIDVGGYSPLLGESFSEIAAVSRSQHKSQGFGSRGTRGRQPEFLEYIKGEKADKDIFEGVNTTWSRVKGGEKIQPLVDAAIRAFDPEHPEASVPALLTIRDAIRTLGAGVWQERKLAETEQLIQDCLGLYIDVTAGTYWSAPGQPVAVQVEMVNRSPVDVVLEHIQAPALQIDSTLQGKLAFNAPLNLKWNRKLIASQSYSAPYWLDAPHDQGKFSVADIRQVGAPENNPAVSLVCTLRLGQSQIKVTRPLHYRWTDPVKGELTRPFEVVPPVLVNLTDNVYIFNDDKPRRIPVMVKAAGQPIRGELKLVLPTGWRSEPVTIPFNLSKPGEETTHTFTVYPSGQEETVTLQAQALVDGQVYNRELQLIQYDHIPTQTLLPPATARLVRLNLKREGQTIGYIRGAGDDVPAALRNLGYTVWEMKQEEITLANLKKADAVVLGVRAINTNERIRFVMGDLLKYVEEGGTLVVQYNTTGDLETDHFSPFPLTLSRDRVTEEDAAVTLLAPEHPVLNYPNKITQADFNGWVQERGLYFPSQWDAAYTPLLSMHDKGEPDRRGSLLVATYGKGTYIYTGLSFFRELPEGVAGAYKLFANLVSAGKQPKPDNTKVKRKNK